MVTGDTRWAGTFGVDADFIARTHCSVEVIRTEDIRVHVASMVLLLVFTHRFSFYVIASQDPSCTSCRFKHTSPMFEYHLTPAQIMIRSRTGGDRQVRVFPDPLSSSARNRMLPRPPWRASHKPAYARILKEARN